MKQKRQIIVLGVLVGIAALTWLLYFRSDGPAIADVKMAVQNFPALNQESPQLRLEEITRARNTEYKGGERPIFSAGPTPPNPIQTAVRPRVDPNYYVAQGPKPPVPPPPPTVPPLPVKYFGFGTTPGGRARVAFFTNSEDVFIVSEGQILMNRFRILRIGNANLDYEEVSSGLRGQAPLEEQAGVGLPTPGAAPRAPLSRSQSGGETR